MNTQQVVLTRCALCSADREPHRRNWTLPHHKHYFWLRPLLLGQKHGEEAAELPGNLWPVLRLWAAGCWISVSTQTFWFSSNKLHLFGCNAKSARCRLGPVAARVQPAGWTGLSLSEWRGGPATETRAGCRGDEPCRSGDHPEGLANVTWFIGRSRPWRS